MDNAGEDRQGDSQMLHRLVFFSDAVIAIVMTLLVLELRPPEAASLAALGKIARHFAAFAGSFALIGIFWAAHMSIMGRLARFDWPVAGLNLIFLFTIALMPFATSMIGEHGIQGLAWPIYSSVLVAASVAQCALLLAVRRGKGRLTGGVAPEDTAYRLVRAASPGIAFSVGLALSLAGFPIMAAFCWLLFPPIFLLARLLRPRPSGTP